MKLMVLTRSIDGCGSTEKNDLIQKVVRIEMKDEKSQLKKKDERIRELESVITSLTLHNLCLLVWKEDIDSKKGSCLQVLLI
jgi:hypothetical protein